jgi:membrane protease YdiL (CAAX protease family)
MFAVVMSEMLDAPLPVRAKKPRLWTLVLAGAAALAISLVAGGAALALVAWRTLGSAPNALAIMAIAKRPIGLALAALCQSLVFAGTALVAAALSPVSMRERLQCSLGKVRGPRWLLLSTVVSISGLSASGSVFNLALAFASGVQSKSLAAIDDAIRAASGPEFALLCVAVSVFAPLGEELFFRGYLQSRLVTRFGAAGGVFLTALWFALAHLDPMHSSATFAMGLVLGFSVLRSGSLWVSVVAHMVNNAIAVFAARMSSEVDLVPSPTMEHLVWSVALALAAALGLRTIIQLTEQSARA